MSIYKNSLYRGRVFAIVRDIPVGKVMTYGQIAIILGNGYTARTVGHVMGGADSENVPWQRVINSQGKCSTGRLTIPLNLQQELLEAEGIVFTNGGKCDLKTFQWIAKGFEPEEDEHISLFEVDRSPKTHKAKP
ncbi:MAG TPA: MGMT family protein [Pyrinomonadaceae bacterium]|nr:MGMT family protein [Chloracidobacterium sp.]MBP9934362.1 MGMT family protein [Pyrinomonadaceae bacterium]MBK7801442.1 MGMT family protein [Chloracidobacterium sp.]MBK9436761.1 MGMT family protein [Chloracidobacterium sp.]MBL0241752.1 MGMT family protein [Chloracidobacterium sp.]